MTTTRLDVTLTIGGTTIPLDLRDGLRITLDQMWAPFATVDVTVPGSDALFAATDPRTMLRGILTVTQSWYSSRTLDDLSAAWAGLTLDDLSAAWAGLTLDDLSDMFGDRWGNDTWRAPVVWTLDLGVRLRDRDYVTDTITYRLMSDERLAQEVYPGATHRNSENLSYRTSWLLDQLGTDVPVTIDESGLPVGAVAPAADLDWSTSVWDALVEAAGSVGVRPWCDEQRVWRYTVASGSITKILTLPRVIAANDVTDRDGEWADAYRHVAVGTDNGAPFTAIQDVPTDSYTGHRKRKVYTQQVGEITELDPPGMVSFVPDPWSAADLAAGRGRQLTVVAPIDIATRPGMGLATGAPSLPALSGQIERVVFDLARAQMTITTRDTATGA